MIVVDVINISDDKIDQRNLVLVAHTTRLDLSYLTDKYNICDITLTSIPDLLLKKPKDKFWLDS